MALTVPLIFYDIGQFHLKKKKKKKKKKNGDTIWCGLTLAACYFGDRFCATVML